MMAKRFFFVSAGVLCLMASALIGFLIGGQAVKAQAPEPITGYRIGTGGTLPHFVMLSNGDLYQRNTSGMSFTNPAPTFVGNYWGDTVPTAESTWGTIKDQYKGKD